MRTHTKNYNSTSGSYLSNFHSDYLTRRKMEDHQRQMTLQQYSKWHGPVQCRREIVRTPCVLSFDPNQTAYPNVNRRFTSTIPKIHNSDYKVVQVPYKMLSPQNKTVLVRVNGKSPIKSRQYITNLPPHQSNQRVSNNCKAYEARNNAFVPCATAISSLPQKPHIHLENDIVPPFESRDVNFNHEKMVNQCLNQHLLMTSNGHHSKHLQHRRSSDIQINSEMDNASIVSDNFVKLSCDSLFMKSQKTKNSTNLSQTLSLHQSKEIETRVLKGRRNSFDYNILLNSEDSLKSFVHAGDVSPLLNSGFETARDIQKKVQNYTNLENKSVQMDINQNLNEHQVSTQPQLLKHLTPNVNAEQNVSSCQESNKALKKSKNDISSVHNLGIHTAGCDIQSLPKVKPMCLDSKKISSNIDMNPIESSKTPISPVLNFSCSSCFDPVPQSTLPRSYKKIASEPKFGAALNTSIGENNCESENLCNIASVSNSMDALLHSKNCSTLSHHLTSNVCTNIAENLYNISSIEKNSIITTNTSSLVEASESNEFQEKYFPCFTDKTRQSTVEYDSKTSSEKSNCKEIIIDEVSQSYTANDLDTDNYIEMHRSLTKDANFSDFATSTQSFKTLLIKNNADQTLVEKALLSEFTESFQNNENYLRNNIFKNEFYNTFHEHHKLEQEPKSMQMTELNKDDEYINSIRFSSSETNLLNEPLENANEETPFDISQSADQFSSMNKDELIEEAKVVEFDETLNDENVSTACTTPLKSYRTSDDVHGLTFLDLNNKNHIDSNINVDVSGLSVTAQTENILNAKYHSITTPSDTLVESPSYSVNAFDDTNSNNTSKRYFQMEGSSNQSQQCNEIKELDISREIKISKFLIRSEECRDSESETINAASYPYEQDMQFNQKQSINDAIFNSLSLDSQMLLCKNADTSDPNLTEFHSTDNSDEINLNENVNGSCCEHDFAESYKASESMDLKIKNKQDASLNSTFLHELNENFETDTFLKFSDDMRSLLSQESRGYGVKINESADKNLSSCDSNFLEKTCPDKVKEADNLYQLLSHDSQRLLNSFSIEELLLDSDAEVNSLVLCSPRIDYDDSMSQNFLNSVEIKAELNFEKSQQEIDQPSVSEELFSTTSWIPEKESGFSQNLETYSNSLEPDDALRQMITTSFPHNEIPSPPTTVTCNTKLPSTKTFQCDSSASIVNPPKENNSKLGFHPNLRGLKKFANRQSMLLSEHGCGR